MSLPLCTYRNEIIQLRENNMNVGYDDLTQLADTNNFNISPN